MDDANPVVKQGGRVTGFVSYGQRAFLKGAADFCFIKGGDFMTRRKICSLLVMLVVTLFASSAMASYVIDFGIRANTGTDSGTISYNGTNGLVGTNIEVDEFSLDGGPKDNGVDDFAYFHKDPNKYANLSPALTLRNADCYSQFAYDAIGKANFNILTHQLL